MINFPLNTELTVYSPKHTRPETLKKIKFKVKKEKEFIEVCIERRNTSRPSAGKFKIKNRNTQIKHANNCNPLQNAKTSLELKHIAPPFQINTRKFLAKSNIISNLNSNNQELTLISIRSNINYQKSKSTKPTQTSDDKDDSQRNSDKLTHNLKNQSKKLSKSF
jgi:hypothetical protein